MSKFPAINGALDTFSEMHDVTFGMDGNEDLILPEVIIWLSNGKQLVGKMIAVDDNGEYHYGTCPDNCAFLQIGEWFCSPNDVTAILICKPE